VYILSGAYFPIDYWPEAYWPLLPSGANIQYTEIYPLTLKAVTSAAFSVVLITSADFAVTMPQVITMATYAELST